MPHTDVRLLLFQDLGKATRRGVRKCKKCGTITGTRGRSCKNPDCDVVFREIGDTKKLPSDSEPCSVVTVFPATRVFSVRIRDRGPDYRAFVQLPLIQPCFGTLQSKVKPKAISFGSRCFVESCSRRKVFPCDHIKEAENSTRESQRILIKESVLSTIQIPTEAKQILAPLIAHTPDTVVQRCSKSSFVVKCNVTSRHPLGYLHILFFKNREDGNNDQKFLCNCQPIKLLRRQNNMLTDASQPIGSNPSKYCLHYYACICAFASDENLKTDFKFVLSRAFSSSLTPEKMLKLHFINDVVVEVEGEHEEEMMQHPNLISEEVMRENLSLLESIAEVNRVVNSPETSTNAENLLSDAIVVTSADDTLSFGDSSTLDSLDEPDPNRSSHLTHISEILNQGNQNNLVVTQAFKSGEVESTPQHAIETELVETGGNPPAANLRSSDRVRKRPRKKISTASSKRNRKRIRESSRRDRDSAQSSLITLESFNEGMADLTRRIISTNFGRWLGSVNERINAAMNYQFDPVCSLIENIPNEIFECLKDRINSGYKGKRFQNQTIIVIRNDKPPLGTFTKHTWKIFNVVHLLHIFQSTQVPLKLGQFFIHLSNGTYTEWNPSKDDEDCKQNKNKLIVPVLHCTKLKIGRLDCSTEKELTPFLIEWIPNTLPLSKMGELSIQFQVTHTGPIHTEDERRACYAPLQRLIQQSQVCSAKK